MKISRNIACILLFMILMSVVIGDDANPFAHRDKKEQQSQSLWQKLKSDIWIKFLELQRNLNQKLSSSITNLKDSFSIKHILILLVFSLLYGMVHAVGPGHGKMLVSAYFLNRKGSIISALRVGSITALTHSGSAIIIGLIFGLVIKASGMNSQAGVQKTIGIIGGILIMILGVFYLLTRFPAIKKKFIKIGQVKNDALMGVLSGIIPCPVAMTIILFSLYLGALYLGLISVIALSVGMAATISAIGIITIKFKSNFLKIFSGKAKSVALIQNIITIIGSGAIILLGAIMVLMRV